MKRMALKDMLKYEEQKNQIDRRAAGFAEKTSVSFDTEVFG